ncbi:carbohydrate ABC transporter permease [Microlunatus speluncae]|uniref:carbohydrate ABC transporter permease n=1 Tax=Microlunatus speluncae TaxID=2594267 RepID=UPI0012662019|nr:sugar ABC transporter permease [Microlunatus speluncae]
MTADAAQQERSAAGPDSPPGNGLRRLPGVVRLIIAVIAIWVLIAGIGTLFQAFAYYPQYFPKLLQGLLAVVLGVGGAAAVFYFINMFVEALPDRASGKILPYAFLLPGVGLIGLMLLYPTVQTINYSFANSDSTAYIGLGNYATILANPEFWSAMINNLLWLLIVPAAVVFFGTIVAVLADRLPTGAENITKSLVFLPMAISFVGAATIWGAMYAYQPAGQPQTGLLNALVTGTGGDPVSWLSQNQLRLNSLLLMVILIWLQVGFGMVLLSSAIKGVPEDTLEAGRIDGANEFQIFMQIVIPQIRGTMVTVFVTLVILVLKVFDIVYVMTNGQFNTDVIANLFFREIFANSQSGVASAIVVVLLIAVTPVLIYQVRSFRKEEAMR